MSDYNYDDAIEREMASDRYLEAEEQLEFTKEALASALAEVEKYREELRRVVEWREARNLADTSETGQMVIRIKRVLEGLNP